MRAVVLGLIAVLVAPAVAGDKPREVTFGKADLDNLPAGWTAAKTGEGEGCVWKVTKDDTTPSRSGFALTQLGKGPSRLFNLCVLDDTKFGDGEVTVMAKSLTGNIDQGGGLAWRYQDANNYYVCRYNPLEENFRVYHVKDGKRTQLATKEKVAVPERKWFAVGVRHTGNKIECSLNGEKLLTVTDETFARPGKVGLWTKADAVTAFDQLKITPAK